MKQRRPRKNECLRASVLFHGRRMDETDRKAVASWLRRAARCLANDADYAAIRNFRLYY